MLLGDGLRTFNELYEDPKVCFVSRKEIRDDSGMMQLYDASFGDNYKGISVGDV
jgi:hypothetical protein